MWQLFQCNENDPEWVKDACWKFWFGRERTHSKDRTKTQIAMSPLPNKGDHFYNIKNGQTLTVIEVFRPANEFVLQTLNGFESILPFEEQDLLFLGKTYYK